MITVYNASNSIEAHLIKNLLEQQEIPAYVFGDYLQGGVGEIPAIGLVTVNVSDSDFTKVKEIIAAWDSATIIDNTAIENSLNEHFGENNGLSPA